MAGDWIKLEHATADKPEVFRIAEQLDIPPEHALGCLIRVWVWADQQVSEGNAVSVTETILDRISRVPGFGAAMVAAEWLEVFDGFVTFPNFERHNGQTAKTRALTAKRVAQFKAKNGNAQVTTRALPREEKRREENSTPPISPPTKKKQFSKPTLAELKAYIADMDYHFDPEAFLAHYNSNGWKVGRNPMKCWKSACRTWEKNVAKFGDPEEEPSIYPDMTQRLREGRIYNDAGPAD